ncbi:lanceolate [Striga asiatica]|uniref:Lanceolate n=1 Tax=Striga asiatica TaxID=4170 RepID=A0A5A7PY58_STRAF|nr:lanceolate [Striga asiatica]
MDIDGHLTGLHRCQGDLLEILIILEIIVILDACTARKSLLQLEQDWKILIILDMLEILIILDARAAVSMLSVSGIRHHKVLFPGGAPAETSSSAMEFQAVQFPDFLSRNSRTALLPRLSLQSFQDPVLLATSPLGFDGWTKSGKQQA